MARFEQDREDLMREATRLLPRASWSTAEIDRRIVTGIRPPGALSVYFGADPVYHFNSRGELRRAFIDGLLWKADRGRLVRMRRARSPEQTLLMATTVEADEQATRLARLQAELATFIDSVKREQTQLIESVGPQADEREYWLSRLTVVAGCLRVANRPHIC